MMQLLGIKGIAVMAACFCAGMACWYGGAAIREARLQERHVQRQDEVYKDFDRRLAEVMGQGDVQKKRVQLLKLREEYLLDHPELSAKAAGKLLEILLEKVNRSDEIAQRAKRSSAEQALLLQSGEQQVARQMKIAQELMQAAEQKEKDVKAAQAQLALKEKELAGKEKELAQAREQVSEIAMDLATLKERLDTQAAQIDKRLAALALQEDALAQKLAKLDSKSQNTSPQVIVVPQQTYSAPSSTFIYRETVPVYIGGWYGRPIYRHHRRPHPVPYRHDSNVGVRIGSNGVSVRLVK